MTTRFCSICQNRGVIEQKVKNLGTLDYNWAWVDCPVCYNFHRQQEKNRKAIEQTAIPYRRTE